MAIDNKNKKTLSSLLGEATPAKASGLTYSLSALLSVVLAFLFVLAISLAGVSEGYEQQDWYTYCTYLITPICFTLVALLIFRWTKVSVKSEIKAQACPAKYFVIAIALQVGLFGLSHLNSLFLDWLEKFGYQDTPLTLPSMDGFGFVGVLVVVALLPAIFEEVIFRGLLLKGMRSFGVVGAVLVNGALFALYHQNPAQTMYQFCCGMAFALMAIRAGSILPTVLSHFINNALILTLTKCNLTTFSPAVWAVVMCVAILCLAGSLYWLIFVERGNDKFKGENTPIERKNFITFAFFGIAFCALTWLGVLFTGM